MQTSLVLTVIGDDRPGIVEQLSDQVLAAGANWEESRMARLAGKFAGVLRVSVESGRAETLATGLKALGTHGLTVVVERSGDRDETVYRAFDLELVGNDHPGIVRDISRVLAEHGVNIEELDTEVSTAAMTGETLFRAHARLDLPSTLAAHDLRRVLESLAGDLMVDINFAEGRQPT